MVQYYSAIISLLGLALFVGGAIVLQKHVVGTFDNATTTSAQKAGASSSVGGSTQQYGRNRRVVLLGPHDRFNFGDLLFAKVVSRLLVTRAGYSPDEILHGGLVSIDMAGYGGPPTVLSMRTISELSRNAEEPYDIVFTGGEALGCDHTCGTGMMMNESLRAQATREKIHDCAYLFPKRLLLPQNNFKNLTNIAVVNSLGGARTQGVCREAEDTADYRAYRDKGPLYPDSAIMTKELFPDEIERGAREALGELGFADDQRFVAVQQFRIAEGIELDLQLPELALALDQVARGMNATVVFFAAGTCPGHDSYETYDRIKSLMKEDAIVYYNGAHVWKVVGLVSRASAVVSTSLHVRIMSFIHSKPRVTWCTGPKHKKFLELWDTKESAPCFVGNKNQTWGLLQSRYLSNPDRARETTASKYNKMVNLYLESFAKYSTLLRPPMVAEEQQEKF
eukprot:CAMPEP_0201117488 /NCGR_PEP_ID=MMETSP0850-20130426/1439_1 /ASSEMBLY_ACC=CAM_ASM_000622 /TAXON_ID=183588 /ORGANISM="Pseudo-nitzschia fraudulenta, Strain WWA7" /LENGTH=450 /DNA_ID=CAMNT_0047381821 /DNA_START=32 /DNA_END=1384 /DNA_ORIENTATION=-